MVPLVLVYCTVLRTLKPCDWPLPSIPFHFFCACVCVHSSDSEPRRSRSLFESRRHPQNQHDVYTDVFATKSSKQASKQEGPLHDKSTSLASQMEMRFALLLFISSPFKLLISLLIYSFFFWCCYSRGRSFKSPALSKFTFSPRIVFHIGAIVTYQTISRRSAGDRDQKTRGVSDTVQQRH